MTPEDRDESPEEAAFDAYLSALLEGRDPDPRGFLAGRGLEVPDLQRRLEQLQERKGADSSAFPFEQLDGFRLIRKIGEGGMGVVYLAEQLSLARPVALKLIRPEQIGSDEAETRFRREAEALARLRHPNIVTVHASGGNQTVRYLAMEFVAGRPLDELLGESRFAEDPIPVNSLVRWLADIGRALSAAHRARIVHRDVKPGNILITPDGRALLTDFGLARDLSRESQSITRGFVGSPHYSAPEQIEGARGQIGPATDVYALGVTLYEAVTGAPPFDGGTTAQLFHRILERTPVSPRKVNPKVSRDLETVIQKALEKNPAARYPEGGAFADDLEALLELRPIQARRTGPHERAVRWIRRNPILSAAAGCILLLLVALALLLADRRLAPERALQKFLIQARGQLERGQVDRALDSVGQALAVRPEDPKALLLRQEIRRARDARLADQDLLRAEELLADYRARTSDESGRASRLSQLRAAVSSRPLDPEEVRSLQRLEHQSERSASEMEQAANAVFEAVNQAFRRAGEDRRGQRILADLRLEQWRLARAGHRDAAARVLKDRVRQLDDEGRHTAELDPRGSVRFHSDPPGAEVMLFRYLEQADLRPDGELRLVPAPVCERTAPPAPGSLALRVLQDHGDLRQGDLILAIEGAAVEAGLYLVTAGEDDRLRPGDLLAEIAGNRVRRGSTVLGIEDDLGDGTPLQYLFVRGAQELIVEADSLEKLGVMLARPETLLNQTEQQVEFLRDGELRSTRSRPGALLRLTAAPLFWDPECQAGNTPFTLEDLPVGSYLAMLRLEGYETQRLPFMVASDTPQQIDVALLPEGRSPRGFVHIPAGVYLKKPEGPAGTAPGTPKPVEVGEFWMADQEVTNAGYEAFLNDPVTQREIEESETAIRYPRNQRGHLLEYIWSRDVSGQFRARPSSQRSAVSAITRFDVDAFLVWLNRIRPDPLGRRFSLPTADEWEKAASGADARLYPFGNRFYPTWVSGGLSEGQPSMLPGAPLQYVRDESPYGVFDMAGNVREYLAETRTMQNQEQFALCRGGHHLEVLPEMFSSSTTMMIRIDEPFPGTGIRLILKAAK